MKIALSSCGNSGRDNYPLGNLSDLEQINDVVLRSENSSYFQVFLDRLNDSVGKFGMCLAPSRCKMLLLDWFGSKLNRVLAREQLNEVNRFGYTSSCTSPSGGISEDVPSHVH